MKKRYKDFPCHNCVTFAICIRKSVLIMLDCPILEEYLIVKEKSNHAYDTGKTEYLVKLHDEYNHPGNSKNEI